MIPSTRSERWQLPDGVDEALPDTAWRVEALRRAFLDLCRERGYELILPPLIEYVDSLLTGTGETLDLQTVKFVDQSSGRLLGVRADITPQAARIDAHALCQDEPNRLCYTGTVVRAQADGFGGVRNPQQFGAELFGDSAPEGDVEMIRLMLDVAALGQLSEDQLLLDLGHVGILQALLDDLALDGAARQEVLDTLLRGSVPDLEVALARQGDAIDPAASERLRLVFGLCGGAEVLDEAERQLAGAGVRVAEGLVRLRQVLTDIRASWPGLKVHIDLSDIRGYRYHTGLLFAVYTLNGTSIAHGGRYDAVGAAFGRARAATGFSGDLKVLADMAALS